jgi:hypothetical protein
VTKKYFLNIDMESEEEFRPPYVQLLTDILYSRCTDRFARILTNQERPRHLSADSQPMRSFAAYKNKKSRIVFEIVSWPCMLALLNSSIFILGYRYLSTVWA